MCRGGWCTLRCKNQVCGRGLQFGSTPLAVSLSLHSHFFAGWTPITIFPAADWSDMMLGSSKGDWHLPLVMLGVYRVLGTWERSHLGEIFSAQKRSDRADGTELETLEWNKDHLWVSGFALIRYLYILQTSIYQKYWEAALLTKVTGNDRCTALFSSGKENQAVSPWQRLFYIREVIWLFFFRTDLNLVCWWVSRSGKLVKSLKWNKSCADWFPGA